MFNKQRETGGRIFQDRPAGNGQPNRTIDQIMTQNVHTLDTGGSAMVDSGSVIGRDLTILGENINIVSRETLQIDGEIRGNVSGKHINIGPSGSVDGSIAAESVAIDGKVKGAVQATNITLNPSAKVNGNLLHQVLVIARGAEFEGSVRRSADGSGLAPDLSLSDRSSTGVPLALSQPAKAPGEIIGFGNAERHSDFSDEPTN